MQILRGLQANIPTLLQGELFFATDTKTFWIGTSTGNFRLAPAFSQTFVRKSANQSLASSKVLQNDTALLFAIGASQTWIFELYIIWESVSGADIDFSVTAPAGTTGYWSLHPQWGAGNAFQRTDAFTFGTSQPMGGAGATTPQVTLLKGIAVSGATAGNITLQWAQNTSNATATTVLADSWLMATRAV